MCILNNFENNSMPAPKDELGYGFVLKVSRLRKIKRDKNRGINNIQ